MGYSDVRHYPGGLSEWMQSAPARVAHVEPVVDQGARGEAVSSRFERRHPTNILYALADRPVNALFQWWLLMVAACGGAYWLLQMFVPGGVLEANGAPLGHDGRALLTAVYFSAVTATSVGYGDIIPIGIARLVAIGESMAGLVIFGMLISKFVSRRQEELIGKIHRIAFEDRLDRLRTNLQLVRTELQTAAQLCEGHAVAPP